MRTIIACEIFRPLIEKFVQAGDDLIWLAIDEHLEPEKLRNNLQQLIDQSNNHEVILVYGICGNATVSLESNNHVLWMLRVHDCTAALLGSNKRFLELFGDNLSQSWTCESYYRNKMKGKSSTLRSNYGLLSTLTEYIEQYGEDNGQYLWDLLQTDCSLFYITFNQSTDDQIIEQIKKDKSYQLTNTLTGDITMLKELMCGDYHQLVKIPPYHRVLAKYDFEEVLYSENC
jgi:hypothetical protein